MNSSLMLLIMKREKKRIFYDKRVKYKIVQKEYVGWVRSI